MTSQPPLLVVLAGGSNSRFWPLREKSLFPFLGRPLLEHQLQSYAEAGFRRMVVVANPGNRERIEAVIEAVIVRGGRADVGAGVELRVVTQEEPRGMGDALLALRPLLLRQTPPRRRPSTSARYTTCSIPRCTRAC